MYMIMVLFFAHHWVSTFDSFSSIEGTRPPPTYIVQVNTIANLRLREKNKSMRNVGGDMVLILCTPSEDGLYWYQNS